MKVLFLLILMLSFNQITAQSIIDFQDKALKEKLLKASSQNKIAKNKKGERIKIDINNDKEIDIIEALAVDYLYLYPGEISDLTGIESFKNLRKLDLSTNNLTKFENIDLPNLESLDLLDNDIAHLNIDNIQNLKYFSCQQNELEVLEINGLPNLEGINCS